MHFANLTLFLWHYVINTIAHLCAALCQADSTIVSFSILAVVKQKSDSFIIYYMKRLPEETSGSEEGTKAMLRE